MVWTVRHGSLKHRTETVSVIKEWAISHRFIFHIPNKGENMLVDIKTFFSWFSLFHTGCALFGLYRLPQESMLCWFRPTLCLARKSMYVSCFHCGLCFTFGREFWVWEKFSVLCLLGKCEETIEEAAYRNSGVAHHLLHRSKILCIVALFFRDQA